MRTMDRRATRAFLDAALCATLATLAACAGREPTATHAEAISASLVAEADVGATAKPVPRLLAYVSGRTGATDLYIMDVANGRSHRLTRDRAETSSPAWSPDGSRIAFTSTRDGLGLGIWVVSVAGGEPVKLTGSNGRTPDWSPDGSRIAYSGFGNGQGDIFVMNANGTGQSALTNTAAFEVDPVWSPDGSRIAFTSYQNGEAQVWVVNADGSNPVQLTTATDGVVAYTPSWSPDGTKIVFVAFRGGGQDIWIMNANGSGQTRLVTLSGLKANPRWSAHGIAFDATVNGTTQLFLVNPDGTGLTQLTRGGTPSLDPTWKP